MCIRDSINIGRLKMGDTDYVRDEIRALKQAVGNKVLKVIIETCLLTEAEKETMCGVVCDCLLYTSLKAMRDKRISA